MANGTEEKKKKKKKQQTHRTKNINYTNKIDWSVEKRFRITGETMNDAQWSAKMFMPNAIFPRQLILCLWKSNKHIQYPIIKLEQWNTIFFIIIVVGFSFFFIGSMIDAHHSLYYND